MILCISSKVLQKNANKALNLAIESAEEMRHNYVGTEHILYGLVKRGQRCCRNSS